MSDKTVELSNEIWLYNT